LYAQHPGHEFVRKGQGVLIEAVVHAQNPAAATRFHSMNGIAGDGLNRLRQQGFALTPDQLPKPGTGGSHLVQALNRDARGRARRHDDIAPECLPSDQPAEKPHDSFISEPSYFGGTAIFQDIHE
jgi:hypothetical protein